jgi:DNA-binding MarR family transcriptional regulator
MMSTVLSYPSRVSPGKQQAELAATLMRVHRQVRTLLGTVAHEFDLTVQQVEMLCVLRDRQPSFRELAELLGCDKTNITGLADRLVRRGLVTRQVDETDRRVARLRLTDEGRGFESKIKAAMAEQVGAHWGMLSREQHAVLTDLVRP